jgi:hypothetical protein
VKPFALTFAFTFALTFTGCHKPSEKPTPCSPGLPSKIEVRDSSGQLELALKAGDPAGRLDVCDPQARRVGQLVSDDGALTLLDGAGQLAARLTRQSATDWSVGGPHGPLLRVHVDEHETRVLKPDGVPFGSVAPKESGATLYSPASVPVGNVAPRGDDQVISGADGATRRYVTHSSSPLAAGMFGVEGLDLPVRALLYITASKSK